MNRYEVLDHTADVAIRAHGESLERLFEIAAGGMFDLIAEVGETTSEGEEEITVEAMDLETLLVGWLRELLLKFELSGQYFVRFSVVSVNPTSLQARAGYISFDPDRHSLLRHIKAVTYHALQVERQDDGWQVTIVFDT